MTHIRTPTDSTSRSRDLDPTFNPWSTPSGTGKGLPADVPTYTPSRRIQLCTDTLY